MTHPHHSYKKAKNSSMTKIPLIKVCFGKTLGLQSQALTAFKEQVDIAYVFDSDISDSEI
jgi:hypothetical protein